LSVRALFLVATVTSMLGVARKGDGCVISGLDRIGFTRSTPYSFGWRELRAVRNVLENCCGSRSGGICLMGSPLKMTSMPTNNAS